MEAIVYLDEPAVPFSVDKIVAEVTPIMAIHSVIFNDPATIVLWANGRKTVVKTQKGEKFDPEKGLAMALVKYFLGNKGSYYEVFKECGAVEKTGERTPSVAHATARSQREPFGPGNENPSTADAVPLPFQGRQEAGERTEFSKEQLKRIDEVENAVFEMCKVLTEDEKLEWDMDYIGEIADLASTIMVNLGHRVRYPAMVLDDDENDNIEDYFDE